jgi:hypothetical protein
MSILDLIVLLITIAIILYSIIWADRKRSNQLYEIYNNLEAIYNIIDELKPKKAQDCGGITCGCPSQECYECKHAELCKEIYVAKTKLINLNTILD